ncbi:MAG: hypothetical protein GC154_09895 [bacterium]|nr:hypothetical protein [bacterium]
MMAAAGVNAAPLSAPPVASLLASPESASARFALNTQEYTFSDISKQSPVEYSLRLSDPRMALGMIQVTGRLNTIQRFIPFYQAGFWIKDASGELLSPLKVASEGKTQLIDQKLEGNRLSLDYEDTIGGVSLRKRYEFSLRGKTLIMRLSDLTGPKDGFRYVGFSFGRARYLGRGRVMQLPTAPFPIMQSLGEYYLSTYIDPFLSNCNRFTYASKAFNTRMTTASNTPAWIEETPGEPHDPLHVTAYLTISDDPLEVLPSRPAADDPAAADLRNRIVMEWNETPFLPTGLSALSLARRWKAQQNGFINLNGTIELAGQRNAQCEVVLYPSGGEPKLLFSQWLNPKDKPATGLTGEFPMTEGDELLFVCRTPAIMTDGEVKFRIQIKQGDETYDSLNDFSGVQGQRGWSYEEARDGDYSLLIWNEEKSRWESPGSRAWQTAYSLVCRSGPRGDAFATAKTFLEQFKAMGLDDTLMVLHNWDERARDEHNATAMQSDAWGAKASLESLEQSLIASGVRLATGMPHEAAIDMTPFLSTSIAELEEDDGEGTFLSVAEPASSETPTADAEAGETNIDVMHIAPPSDPHLTEAVYRFAWNMPFPYLLPGEFPLYVDDALRNQRARRPVTGFGGYAAFLGEPDDETVDARFFPMDEYLTATVCFGRVPHLSDAIWKPGQSAREIARDAVAAYGLLKPVMAEILDPFNAPSKIEYFDESGQAFDAKGVLLKRSLSELVNYNRLHIEYANGLNVWANRSNQEWHLESGMLGTDRIKPGGFLARNERTGVFAVIGRRGHRTYSASLNPTSIFIQSRDEGLLRLGDYAADGVCRMTQGPAAGLWNITLLNAHEVDESNRLRPLLRSNETIDCALQWLDPNHAKLTVFHCNDGAMVELFAAPSAWFDDNAPLNITRKRAGADDQAAVEWSRSENDGQPGIRVSGVNSGDVYTFMMGE